MIRLLPPVIEELTDDTHSLLLSFFFIWWSEIYCKKGKAKKQKIKLMLVTNKMGEKKGQPIRYVMGFGLSKCIGYKSNFAHKGEDLHPDTGTFSYSHSRSTHSSNSLGNLCSSNSSSTASHWAINRQQDLLYRLSNPVFDIIFIGWSINDSKTFFT